MRLYPAKFIKEENGQYTVLFQGRGMDGCITYGNNLEHAKQNAEEALNLYIETLFLNNEKIPYPSSLIEGADIYRFPLSSNIMFSIYLRREREKKKLTQEELALKAGLELEEYKKLEIPSKANPTLETMLKLQKALDKRGLFLRYHIC